MQDVVAYLMHVDGRHLQTVLNPAMHAHSQVLSAPSVNTEPSHSIRVIHGPSYGPIAPASTGAGCPELSPPSGFHETERRLGAVGHIAVQLAHLLQEVRATVDVRTGSHLRSDCADASETAPRLRRDSRHICAAAAQVPRRVDSHKRSAPQCPRRSACDATPQPQRGAVHRPCGAGAMLYDTHARPRTAARTRPRTHTRPRMHAYACTPMPARAHTRARAPTHAHHGGCMPPAARVCPMLPDGRWAGWHGGPGQHVAIGAMFPADWHRRRHRGP